ncbi:MAG: hypothetical protein Q8K59_01150 [Nitrosomonas sp.]|nr:hypothetical protein [Nitrosomonas sp.]
MKADFDRLGGEGKITHESQTIMNSLFMIVELILAIFLERGTQKNNGNSSKPSSRRTNPHSAIPAVTAREKAKTGIRPGIPA